MAEVGSEASPRDAPGVEFISALIDAAAGKVYNTLSSPQVPFALSVEAHRASAGLGSRSSQRLCVMASRTIMLLSVAALLLCSTVTYGRTLGELSFLAGSCTCASGGYAMFRWPHHGLGWGPFC